MKYTFSSPTTIDLHLNHAFFLPSKTHWIRTIKNGPVDRSLLNDPLYGGYFHFPEEIKTWLENNTPEWVLTYKIENFSVVATIEVFLEFVDETDAIAFILQWGA